MPRKNWGSCTYGAAMDVDGRAQFYAKLNLYRPDTGMPKLRPTPAHWTAADVSLREVAALMYCKADPILGPNMSNIAGGGESLKINNFDPRYSGSYFHIGIPGVSGVELNIARAGLNNVSEWRKKNFKNLHLLSPLVIEKVSSFYSDLPRIYAEKTTKAVAKSQIRPIYDAGGKFSMAKTFDYELVCKEVGLELKPGEMEKFNCDHCDQSFVRASNYNIHLANKHKIYVNQ
jgi:hypothetical protein